MNPRLLLSVSLKLLALLACLMLAFGLMVACMGAARSSQLMEKVPRAAVVEPPTTNHSASVVWDTVPSAMSYRVYWEWNLVPTVLSPHWVATGTNFAKLDFGTNTQKPLIIATAVDINGIESEPSTVLAYSNWVTITLYGSPTLQKPIPWAPIYSFSLVNPTNPAQFFNQGIIQSNNWPQ